MGIRKWRKVANEVKNNWTRGMLGDSQYGHCALGAIGYAGMGREFDHMNGYVALVRDEEAREMVKELAVELVDTVPKQSLDIICREGGFTLAEVPKMDPRMHANQLQHLVLSVNDRKLGQSRIQLAVNRIVARREAKNAERYAKRKEREAAKLREKQSKLRIKNMKVEYMPAGLETVSEKVSEKA